MTLVELKKILEATEYPVAYSHFTATDTNPLPKPPYLCYLVAYSSNFIADDEVYQEIDNVQIELYTSKKDLNAEENIRSVFKSNKIPYQTTETFLESEQLFQKIYEIKI